MVALSAAGWTVPPIAKHLGYGAETVRRRFRRWAAEGWAVVRHQPPGPAPDTARRAQGEAALRRLLKAARTWPATQLAQALPEPGIRFSARRTRRSLRGIGSGGRRPQRTRRHKQDPARVARAAATLAHFANRHKPAS